MPLPKWFRWILSEQLNSGKKAKRARPRLQRLESREVPANYVAVGASPGNLPWAAIRVDIQDSLGGPYPNSFALPPSPRSDGRTDALSQLFYPFTTALRGGVNVATGNFDGQNATPDSLVTAAGAGGGPHVIVWKTKQNFDGTIVTDGILDQFFAYDGRFRGGVNVACGDLDGDGKAEIITGAGAGGGPHVRIWKLQANGRFAIANEFFAFDPSFRGGVNVASGQGYKTVVQQRLVIQSKLPDGFQVTPYSDIPTLQPGATHNIPLVGSDFPVPNGFSVGFGGYTADAGVTGHFRMENSALVPRTYFTVAGGNMQYATGNLLNSYNNIYYRPDIFVDPAANDDNVGKLVYAKWTADKLPVGKPFLADVTYGPFVKLTGVSNGTAIVDRVTRLTAPPDQVTFKNQLVIGAGPGGGPHVKIYDFTGTSNGKLINNGVGNEFFAFDASFRGGVSVAVGDVQTHTDPSFGGVPGRTDYQDPLRPTIVDNNQNSGTQDFFQSSFAPEVAYRNTPEIVVGMASQGSQVRVFADVNPTSFDSFTGISAPPASRRTIRQLNLQPYDVETQVVFDPNNPLGGFYSTVRTDTITRGVVNPTTNTTGVRVAVSYLNFGGGVTPLAAFNNNVAGINIGGLNYGPTGQTTLRGFGSFPILHDTTTLDAILQGGRIPVNTSLGQVTIASNFNGVPRVRLFNEMGPYLATDSHYLAWDDFVGNPNDGNGTGTGSVAFGLGKLPEPSLDVYYANYATAKGGAITDNKLNFADVQMVTDPIYAGP